MILIAACSTVPKISKETSLGIVSDLTEPEPAKPCKRSPPAKPYPVPDEIQITTALDDIEQGRKYGDAYIAGRSWAESREAVRDVIETACAEQIAAVNERNEAQAAARAAAIEELDEIDTTPGWQFWKR